MNISLTPRAKEHIESMTDQWHRSRHERRLLPGVIWTQPKSQRGFLFGLIWGKVIMHREAWWVFGWDRQQIQRERIATIAGIEMYVGTETEQRLEGKTLDFVDGHLEEVAGSNPRPAV